MSPFWIDYRLSLSAEGLVLVALQGRLGVRRELHRASQPLPAANALAQSLGEMLAACKLPPRARARVKVVIGEPFVRYMALPWQDGLYTLQDWQAYARHMMAAHFSEEQADWQVSTALSGYGNTVLAAAIEQHLLTAVHTAIDNTPRCSLYSVRPLLGHAMQRRQFSILRASYGLVLVSLGSASCVFVDHGQCLGVVSLPLDSHAGLAAMLTDATLLCEVRRPRYLYVLATGSATLGKEHLRPLGRGAKWLGSADPVLWGRKLNPTQFAELTGHGEF